MPVHVKICGLTSPAALDAALAAGADMVGFVSFPPSPRHIGLARMRALGRRVEGRARKVALVVDESDEGIAAIIAALAPDMLQLHGHETPERVASVRARFGLAVMKALPIATRADLAPVGAYAAKADRLLFDARAPRGATRPGGLGTPFDWRLLADIDPGIDFMLSGGLNADNVAQALAITHAPWVDVSSGVERAPGVKVAAKIRAFVAAARAAEGNGKPRHAVAHQ
ncbi:MAG: phosphoribosylanthranilate isomerase [Proteobacteria bacterium]|nr:phosphoribosylanthranilate isomerase [Pseudomonadota bacterium]